MAKNTHIIEVKTIGSKNAIKSVAAVTAGLIAFAKAIGVATDLAKQSAKVDALERGFDALGSKIGFTSGSLEKLRGAVDGTVNDMNLMQQANNAMMLGVVKSDEEMAQLFDTAQRLGQALGVETTDAVNSLVTGMGRQSKLMLDNLGIIVDTQSAYDKYAEKLGIATSQLDDLQKKEAFNEEVLKISNDMVGELGTEVLDGVTAFAQLETSIFNARTAIGEALSPVIQNLAGFFGMAADKVSDFMRGFTETPLERTIKDMQEMGLETTELELTLNKLAQSRASESIAKGFENQGNVLNKLNVGMRFKKLLIQDEADLMQKITDLTKDEMDIQTFINQLMSSTHEISHSLTQEQKQQLINDAVRLQNKLEENEENQNDAERRIEFAEQQLENQAKLNKLKVEEVQLNKQALDTTQTQGAKNEEILKEETSAAKIRRQILEDGTKAQIKLTEQLKATSEKKKLEDIKDALRAASKAAVKAYQWASGWGGPIAGSIAGATAFAAASALADKVQQFATGADYITDGPQMIMVGDNPSGKERVQVTPLGGDPNINGPQGGVTLNISNPIMTDEFVEGEIIPKIREGIRLGENIGI